MGLVRQYLRWTFFGWVMALVIALFYALLGQPSLQDALFAGALFASVCLVGIGALSLGGGGIVWVDVTTRAVQRRERERWDEDGAIFTPLGAALLTVPQLMVGAILLGRLLAP